MKYSIQTKPISFKDENHFRNHIKYLYSCSQGHQENELTQYNSYVLRGNGLEKAFNDNAKEHLNHFNKIHNEMLKTEKHITYKNFTMVIHYMFFAFVHKNDVLFTNIFRQNEKGEIESCLDENMFNMIAQQEFNGDTDALERKFDELLEGIRKVNHFDDFKPVNKRAATDNLVNFKVGGNTYIAMTHIDQNDGYHIHTLEYRE